LPTAQTYEYTPQIGAPIWGVKENNSLKMSQTTVSERIKVLVQKLGISVRAFSTSIGVPDTTTRNYIDRGTNPKADYLSTILRHYEGVNPNWLFTGEGDVFLPGHEPSPKMTGQTRSNYGNNVERNKGTITQHTGSSTAVDNNDIKLALALKEVESLRAQLAGKDALIAAQQETIELLKSAYSRPN
jgi:hypothetical protein